jgi:hypothetical protein
MRPTFPKMASGSSSTETRPRRTIDPITLRRWRQLTWRDPYTDLVALGKLYSSLKAKGYDATVDDLRSREVRPFLEQRQAALFAYFISSAVIRAPIAYAMVEAEDYDCVLWSKKGGVARGQSCYTPVQLKEVVPREKNPKASIESELAKLKKYGTSKATVVAVHVNQTGLVNYSAIKRPNTSVREIWLYASITPDQAR